MIARGVTSRTAGRSFEGWIPSIRIVLDATEMNQALCIPAI